MTEKELSYGASLCPVCKENEVIYAKQCKACYQAAYQKNYRKDYLKTESGRAAAKRAEAAYRARKKVKKSEAKTEPQTIRIEVHIYIHQPSELDQKEPAAKETAEASSPMRFCPSGSNKSSGHIRIASGQSIVARNGAKESNAAQG